MVLFEVVNLLSIKLSHFFLKPGSVLCNGAKFLGFWSLLNFSERLATSWCAGLMSCQGYSECEGHDMSDRRTRHKPGHFSLPSSLHLQKLFFTRNSSVTLLSRNGIGLCSMRMKKIETCLECLNACVDADAVWCLRWMFKILIERSEESHFCKTVIKCVKYGYWQVLNLSAFPCNTALMVPWSTWNMIKKQAGKLGWFLSVGWFLRLIPRYMAWFKMLLRQ